MGVPGCASWRPTLVFLTIFVITFEPFTRFTYFFRIWKEKLSGLSYKKNIFKILSFGVLNGAIPQYGSKRAKCDNSQITIQKSHKISSKHMLLDLYSEFHNIILSKQVLIIHIYPAKRPKY